MMECPGWDLATQEDRGGPKREGPKLGGPGPLRSSLRVGI